MNTTGVLDFFRSQMVDEKKPYLWTDDEAFVFMNEAQSMFCRLTDGIADATTPAVTTLPISAGEIFAEVHPSILLFRSAVLLSTGYSLDIKNHTDVTKWTNQIGTITQMIIGLQKDLVRWNYMPNNDDEVQLLVYRLPLEALVAPDQELEIEPVHHASLVYWMKHLAYAKQDVETWDQKASETGKAMFEEYCKRVRAEQERYKHKSRSILYGGL